MNAGDPETNYAYSCARHNLYLNKHIPCENVDAAIGDLKNDERIDFAIRSGMIALGAIQRKEAWIWIVTFVGYTLLMFYQETH